MINKAVIKCINIAMFRSCFVYEFEIKVLQHVYLLAPISISI
jgi:hypothetical protein